MFKSAMLRPKLGKVTSPLIPRTFSNAVELRLRTKSKI